MTIIPLSDTVTRMAGILNESVAAQIRRSLVDAGRSQGDLATALGWSDAYLSRRLTGQVMFSLSDIEVIAAALDLPRSELLEVPLPQRSRRK